VAGSVKTGLRSTQRIHAMAADRPPPVNRANDRLLHPRQRSRTMSKGDKSSYTDKQKRQAAHIEKSEKKEGKSEKTAERIAWATVNKQDGGGKKS
jgi:hypothetical protein